MVDGSRLRRVLRLSLLVGVAAAAGLLQGGAPEAAFAGDPKIAETLFKSGKQALQKGDSEGAISYFRKAHEENSDLVEAVWWVASAQEKAGDKGGALASYREYLALLDVKVAVAPASKEEARLKGLAEKAIAALATGEKEFQKLEDAYVASLMQFAKDNFARDPGIALKALALLLDVRKDHEEAISLREKLGGGEAEEEEEPAAAKLAEPVGPFKAVKKWRDLIQERVFKSDLFSYTSSGMITESREGKLATGGSFIDVGSSFAYESEFKVLEEYGRGWFFGHAWGVNSEHSAFISVIVGAGSIAILQVPAPGAPLTEIAQWDMPPIALNTWHRFGVIVNGPEVDIWFDGKSVLKWTDPSGNGWKGDVAVYHQRCKTLRRLFRVGRLD